MADESEKPPSNQIVIKPNPYTTILDNDQNTILHYSAARGKDEDFAKKLIKNQKLDVQNYLGWTPMMMACRNGRISTVKILLELGADVTKHNKYGKFFKSESSLYISEVRSFVIIIMLYTYN